MSEQREKHLIYKEDLLDEVLGHFGMDLAYLGEDLQFCQEAIDMAPNVDAVEVVRCGKCRFVDTDDCPMSGTPGRVSASDFCSYGERRTDG